MLDEKTMVSDALAGVKCPRKNFIRLPAKKVIMFLPPKLPIRKSHM